MWAELREDLGMPKHPRTSDSRDFSPLLGLKGPGSGNRNADRKIVGVEEMEQGLLLQPLVTGCFCRKFWGVGDGNKYLPSSFLLLSLVDLIRSQKRPVGSCGKQEGMEDECGPRGSDRTYSAALVTTGTGWRGQK